MTGTRTFGYDGLYRLTGETGPGYTRGYGYDGAGNRTTEARGTDTYYSGYDASNRLLWRNKNSSAAPTSSSSDYRLYRYDDLGNLIGRVKGVGGVTQAYGYGWDEAGGLRGVGEGKTGSSPELWATSRFAAQYDADGTRVRKTDAWPNLGGAHAFQWGAGGLLTDATGSKTTTYTPGWGYRQTDTGTSLDRYFLSDWMGSQRGSSDGASGTSFPNSYDYDGYGNLIASVGTDTTDERYGGLWGYESEDGAQGGWDGTGLLYLRARYYDPEAGRFVSEDPIGYGGGYNLYAYCEGNPIGCVDPSGLLSRKEAEDWYMNGMGGTSDWVDRNMFMNKAKKAGDTQGRYDAGCASKSELIGAYGQAAALGAAEAVLAEQAAALAVARLAAVRAAAAAAATTVAANPHLRQVALDNDALIALLERGAADAQAVQNVIANRTPVVYNLSAQQFLVKGDVNVLMNFLNQSGGQVISNPPPASDVQALIAEGIDPADAEILASANDMGIHLITMDSKMLRRGYGIPW